MDTIRAGTRSATQIPRPSIAPARPAAPAPRSAAPAPRSAAPKSRPDPTALRIAGGFAAVAAASAMVSAMLAPAPAGSAAGAAAGAVGGAVTAAAAAAGQPEVVHVVRYVTLKPGQTAPPQAVVQQQAAPAPRIVTVTTHQSGAKP